jgi:hypothetical protein
MRSLLFMALLLVAVCVTAQSGDAPRPPGPIYKVGEKGVKPPKVIFSPPLRQSSDDPGEYDKETAKGKHKHVTGTVVITGYVGADGHYYDAKAIRARGDQTSEMSEAAVKKVGQWRFDPCTKDGLPVNCYFGLVIDFNLY